LSGKGGTDGISSIDYGNDNQISAVDNATRPDESYSFNALGIRAGWVTDAADKRRVLNDGIYQYQYDDEGNLTQKKEIASGKVTSYVWDYRNRLTRVTSGSQVVEYGYDAEDRRVSKTINGVVKEKYVYDGDDIALVVDAGGTIVERYLYGDGVDNVLSRVSAGTTVWSLGDRQGSVVDVVDEGGNVLNHFVYDSFGNRTSATGADFRFGYTGRELDTETGLYYYRARYYDPSLGRFISEDPIGFSAGDTNLYRYVNNSPTNFTDPTGEIAFLPILGMVAMGAMNALIDVNVQLAVNNMTDKTDINWASVGVSFVTGMLGFGLAQKAAQAAQAAQAGQKVTQAGAAALKIAANPLLQRTVDSGIDGVGKIVENGINGKAWNNELAETVAGNFLLGSAADLGIKGGGAALKATGRLATSAWDRYGDSVIAGVNGADRWGGRVLNLMRNPWKQGQELTSDVMTMGGRSGGGFNWDESADPFSQQIRAMMNGGNNSANIPEGWKRLNDGSIVSSSVPSVKNDEFKDWFDSLTSDELNNLWSDQNIRESIESRLRSPGGLHEWHMVSRAPKFKEWGVSAEQIRDMRTAIDEVEFINPVGRHGRRGSTKAHNEILKIIDTSQDYDTFVRRLQNWANYRLPDGVDGLPPGLRS
jgi:RHS repeat-associated protein